MRTPCTLGAPHVAMEWCTGSEPSRIPAGMFAISKPRAINAARFTADLFAFRNPLIKRALDDFRAAQTTKLARAKLS